MKEQLAVYVATNVSCWPVAACAAQRITLSNLKNQPTVDRFIADVEI
jgi:hypothetical protein